MKERRFLANGVDATTGAPLLPAMTIEQMTRILLRRRPSAALPLAELRDELEKRPRLPSLEELAKAPLAGADPRRLEETGWGVVFARDSDPAVREALLPLLELRRRQATRRHQRLYRELTGENGFRPGETKLAFLARHHVGPGPADPVRMPYYLLLVGCPSQIPFEAQYQLDVQYAVGRLHFETPEEYARYAQTVVEAESGVWQRERRASFFGVHNRGDEITRLMADQLVRPLFQNLASKTPRWLFEAHLGEQASKARLAELVGAEAPPAFLFTASHGLGFPVGHPEQRARQGSLICQDWPGPATRAPIGTEHCLAASDVVDAFCPRGLVAFHYACYSAGTPRWDDFVDLASPERSPKAPREFVARLPQRLLAHPRGGALAVVGHVERAWDWSFRWLTRGAQLAVFESALTCLFKGFPVGLSFEYFNQRHAELAVELAEMSTRSGADPELGDLALAELSIALRDARNYILLGDPAVRLAVAEDS